MIDLAVSLALVAAQVVWKGWTHMLRRSVPGSHLEAHYKARCRLVRYPGAAFWPYCAVGNAVSIATGAVDPWWLTGLVTLLTLFEFRWSAEDIRELRRQIKDDDDDPWNRGKRAAKRAGAAMRRMTLVRPALPAGAGA